MKATVEMAVNQRPASHGGPGSTWGVRAALFALDCYKAYVSPWFAGACRFEPTCSHYAYQAMARFGVLRGVWLGTQRLLRCHPLSGKFGYDPVPESWEEMKTQVPRSARNERVERSTVAAPHEVRP